VVKRTAGYRWRGGHGELHGRSRARHRAYDFRRIIIYCADTISALANTAVWRAVVQVDDIATRARRVSQ